VGSIPITRSILLRPWGIAAGIIWRASQNFNFSEAE